MIPLSLHKDGVVGFGIRCGQNLEGQILDDCKIACTNVRGAILLLYEKLVGEKLEMKEKKYLKRP